MNLAIFGGTGGAGRLLVREALAAGHDVTVLARTPSRLAISGECLRVIRGDALDPGSVREVVTGADAIISLLGPQKDAPPLAVSRATANIIAAARMAGVRRLIVTACVGVGDARGDMAATVELARASELNCTLVRVSCFTDSRAQRALKALCLTRRAGMCLSRSQLAAFLLLHATDTTGSAAPASPPGRSGRNK